MRKEHVFSDLPNMRLIGKSVDISYRVDDEPTIEGRHAMSLQLRSLIELGQVKKGTLSDGFLNGHLSAKVARVRERV